MMRSGLVIGLALSLIGCVIPYSGIYYSPSASEGKVGSYGDWYAPNTLYLKRGNDVQIHVIGYWAVKLPNQRQEIVIEIWMRPQATLNVDVRRIVILNGSSEEIAHLHSFIVRSSDWAMQKPAALDDTSLNGDVLQSKYWTVYSLSYIFNNVAPQQFYVQLPEMQSDNVSYSPLMIEFTKTHGWWWQPIM